MAGDSTVGTLEINLRAGTATFKGDLDQATALVAKAGAQMRQSGAAMNSAFDMGEAKGSLALISEEIGVHIPRHLRTFIAELPGVGTALNAAFSSVAVVALIEVAVKAGEKIKEYWEQLGHLSDEQQKMYDKSVTGAKKLLDAQVDNLKAEYELRIAKVDGLEKDRLRTEEAKALFGFHESYVKSLQGEQKSLSLIYGQMQDAKASTPESVLSMVKNFAQGNVAAAGSDFGAIAYGHQTEDAKSHLEKLNEELRKGQNEFKRSEAGAISAGTALKDHVAKAAKEAADRVKELVNALHLIQSAYPTNRRGFGDFLPGVTDADATGRMRQLQGAGDIFSQIPAPKSPVYTGSDSAMELAKIKAGDQQTMLAAAKQVAASLETENQKWREQLQIVTALYEAHKLTPTEFVQASKQIQEHINGTSTSWRQLGAQIATTAEQAALMGRSWKDVFKSMAVQVTELILKMTLLKDVQGAASGGGGGGGGWGGFFGSLLGGLTHHDIGGSIGPGQWGMTGEKGPEPVYGGVSGVTVFPHGSMRESGGGQVNYYVDASGANAADVEMRVQRALTQVHKSAVVQSVAAQREMSRRMPQGSGKRF